MSDFEDDKPLVKAKSSAVITKAMDASVSTKHTNHELDPAVSLAMGPVKEKVAAANGSKRKSLSNGKSYKELSDDEDDIPLKKKHKSLAGDNSIKKTTKTPALATSALINDSEDDIPLGKKIQKEKASIEKKAEKEAKAIRAAEKAEKDTKAVRAAGKAEKEIKPIRTAEKAEKEAKPIQAAEKTETKRKAKQIESDDDVPLVKKSRTSQKTNGVKKVKQEDSDDDVPLSKKAPAKKSKKDTPQNGKAKVKTEEDNDEVEAEEEYKWWEDPTKGDGSIKWTTLEHNGVVFPPEYVPLPKNVCMLYNGEPVTMQPEAEEIAYAFGSMLNSEHNVGNPVFQKNFFTDLKEALTKTGGAKNHKGEKVKIVDFEKCDFTNIFEYVDAERQAKKALPASQKKAIKAEKDEKEAAYLYCQWDGRKQKVGNFRVEPPGLFRGRGEHPKTGHFKRRVLPEQVTINIGKDAMVPRPPEGHKWKEVKHDQTGTWLAMWQENINGNYKYVMLAANSDVKGQSDHKKFEKARELKKHIDRIRKEYTKDLKSPIMVERQRATAVYLIDELALRAGNEKGEDEADTVGCCSLKLEHITLEPPKTVIFDFLGKDSIRFYNVATVDEQVFKNLKIFKKEKTVGDEVFDRLTTTGLNKHLSNWMEGLTAKVFRTYNASWTMNTQLQNLQTEKNFLSLRNASIPEKIKAYNDANREVAVLCNHKRTVGAGHTQQMEKMDDKIKGMRFQQWRLKQMMLNLEPGLNKEYESKSKPKSKAKPKSESKSKSKPKSTETDMEIQTEEHDEGYFDLPHDLDNRWVAEHHKALVEAEKIKITKKFEKENEKLVADKQKPLKDSELKSRLEVANELEAKLKKELKTGKVIAEGKGPTVEKLEEQVKKLNDRISAAKMQSEDRESNKEVALGTSKINYIDPRLTVAFSKKFNVPIERFFSKTLREKFEWAIKSVDENWEF